MIGTALMVATIRALSLIFLFASLAWIGAYADEKRVALVIGNANYTSAPPLHNPLNDADAMSAALKVMGFEVLDGRDLNKEAMDRILVRFGRELVDAQVAWFYYAGHGLQFLGQNYLLPIDARVEDEIGLRFETTKVDDVISTLANNTAVRILVLDACRNSPFAERLAQNRGARGIALDRGLARIERAQGMLIAYATQPNQVAEDGDGPNSPFTAALAEEIKRPGLEVATVFRHVQTRVNEATQGRQTPELSLSLLGEFYLKREPSDLEAWHTVALDDPAELEAFIARFPDSILRDAARLQLDAITAKKELAERDRRVRDSNDRIQQLEAEIRQTTEELAVVKQADRQRVIGATPIDPSSLANPVASAVGADAHREEVEAGTPLKTAPLSPEIEAENRLAALQAEKSREEAERAAIEKAVAERLANSHGEHPLNPKEPAPDVPRAANAPDPPALTKSKRQSVQCRDLLVRAQLGELSVDDIDALKKCR
jgi:uncharacterized caspase-like protein